MSSLIDLTLDISQQVEINASMEDAYGALVRRLSSENSSQDNQPMPMVLEEWPGGRWFRDLGNNQGHLWGFVQVIKPPKLIEIQGPMFMSYPVAGHLQLRLSEIESGNVELSLRHQVLGNIHQDHRQGLQAGWGGLLNSVKTAAE